MESDRFGSNSILPSGDMLFFQHHFFFDDAVFSSACISGILAEYQGTVITRLHLSFLFYSIDLHVCLSTSTVLFFVLWLCNIS